MIQKWDTISSEFIGNFRVFDLYKHNRKHPKTQCISEFTALDTPNWVNIIPLTTDNEVILVEQYRHGTDKISIEIPAGIIENDEDPVTAAKRECLEETGYCSDIDPILIGTVRPNPAFLNNYCYHYLWKNVEKVTSQHLDFNEDINIIKISLSKFDDWIKLQKIDHSLVISAMFFFNQLNVIK